MKHTLKLVSHRRRGKPKTQTAAIWQFVKSLEDCTYKQEKESDKRLKVMLEVEKKRDELFLKFQRQQAQANRDHELVMASFVSSCWNKPTDKA